METNENKKRCHWCNLNNPLYVHYHDYEWGKLDLRENYLFEMLILEMFQAGLSWECVLNKRGAFRKAYEGFVPSKVASFSEEKIASLCSNKDIIRNKRKILASVENSKIFLSIEVEYASFSAYLMTFTGGKIMKETESTSSSLSDAISLDLRKRGMKYVGTKVVYSFLQAVGIINSHDDDCYLANSEN